MKKIFLTSIKYFFGAIFKPVKIFKELKANENKLKIGFQITFVFALMYTLTAYLLYTGGIKPALDPWMPLNVDDYYLYQTSWTIAWGLLTWILISGVTHLVAITGKADKLNYRFEDALSVSSLGWVIPSFWFMWIYETLFAPFGLLLPDQLDAWRVMILPNIWQIVLFTLGVRMIYDTNWVKSILIGILSVTVVFIMFLPFMR